MNLEFLLKKQDVEAGFRDGKPESYDDGSPDHAVLHTWILNCCRNCIFSTKVALPSV